MYDMSGSAVV